MYPLLPVIDKDRIRRLLPRFQAVVKREQDKSLARKLEQEILDTNPPSLRQSTLLQLAKWCKTGGIYSEGMLVARQISEALFGLVLDRRQLGV